MDCVKPRRHGKLPPQTEMCCIIEASSSPQCDSREKESMTRCTHLRSLESKSSEVSICSKMGRQKELAGAQQVRRELTLQQRMNTCSSPLSFL